VEFHEKLQQLRKSRGITQEELSEALFVSRTAVSKWESGKGYPSIESLKAISKYYSVSIDDLLSGESLLLIAENENENNMKVTYRRLFGVADICTVLLMLMPLYPFATENYIYSVSLFHYTHLAPEKVIIYWFLFSLLVLCGIVNIVTTQLDALKLHKTVTVFSICTSVFTVAFLAFSREAYACTLLFVLLVIKAMLLFKEIKRS